MISDMNNMKNKLSIKQRIKAYFILLVSVLMLVQAGAKISNLGDVRWVATEDGSEGKGTGRHIAQFVLEGRGEENI